MYKKKLLTITVGAALIAAASCTVGGAFNQATVKIDAVEQVEAMDRLEETGAASAQLTLQEEPKQESAPAPQAEEPKQESAPAPQAEEPKQESGSAPQAEEPSGGPDAGTGGSGESSGGGSSSGGSGESSGGSSSSGSSGESSGGSSSSGSSGESSGGSSSSGGSGESSGGSSSGGSSTETPSTGGGSTGGSSTETPSTGSGSTGGSSTETPSTGSGSTGGSSTETPSTGSGSTESPSTGSGSTESPSTGGSSTESPSTGGSQTETPSTGMTERPSESETPGQSETQMPGETQPGTEQQTGESETGTGESETGESSSESESESESETESEEESESETSEYDSNEELIAHQNIVVPPKIELEFRFTQVEKQYGIIRSEEGASVYEKKSTDAREVGSLEYYGLCYILEESEGWYYVESGNVRGFVQAEDVLTGDPADRIVKIKGIKELPIAHLIVARSENAAFTYTHTTVQEVLAKKDYAVAVKALEIHEQRKDDSRVTGTLAEGGLCYQLADQDKDWIFVESGDVRGFVKKSELITGKGADRRVSEKGENNMALASLKVKPEDNKACYYTLTSVKEASQEAKTREAMVNFALQFVGNPYVWGGTSLTHGCDCSGYVQSIYSYFGYSLPRVADAQSVYGMQIPISSAEPGDLIFYAKNGYVYHVSMYIGNGQVVHAAGRRVGIITSGISGNAVWATRIIQS